MSPSFGYGVGAGLEFNYFFLGIIFLIISNHLLKLDMAMLTSVLLRFQLSHFLALEYIMHYGY